MQKLKKLHYSPPRLPPQPPADQLAQHPLFSALAPTEFKRKVSCHN